MNEYDQTYFEDMLSYGHDAIEFLGDMDAEGLAANKRTRYALIRAVEIVGEAANKVSAAGKADLPDLPWHAIIGMRNTLIHGYRGVNLNLLVQVVRDSLPALVMRLEELLGESSQ